MDIKGMDEEEGDLDGLLQDIMSLIGSAGNKKAHKLLSLYVGNLADNPENPEFRSIKLTNSIYVKVLGPFPQAIRFLELAGFKKQDEALVAEVPVQLDALNRAKQALQKCNLEAIEPKANPPLLKGSSSSEKKNATTEKLKSRLNKSEKSAPFVGLVNQGATCYLNSYLQTLFHNGLFRQVLFSIPADTEVESVDSISNALQDLCINVNTKNSSCRTSVLTKAFGWTSQDVFQQHDVQELSRILCERIEKKCLLKHSKISLSSLLSGTAKNFVKCLDVPYVSTRTEEFWDISLNVNELISLEESFRQYFTPELLDKENMYKPSDELGPQRAEKGLTITKFPTILQLHLKRFDFDPWTMRRKKINSKFTFPEKLDLSQYCETKDDGSAASVSYSLFSVLAHAGGATGGHYFSFLNTSLGWVKFDDERVTHSNLDEVFDAGYGQGTRSTSAYMLVYVDENCLADVQKPFHQSEVSEELLVSCLVHFS
jgi:ubiquitin C-terminal hydrolase